MNEHADGEPTPCDIDAGSVQIDFSAALLARLAASAGERAYISFVPLQAAVAS